MHASHAVLGAVVALAACGGSETGARGTTTAVRGGPRSIATPSGVASTWDAAAGPALLVFTGPDPGDASVVTPEVTDIADSAAQARAFDRARTLVGRDMDLFSRGGASGSATVNSVGPAGAEACAAWPVTHVQTRVNPAGWAIGLIRGSAAPIALDSIEHLSPGDSARLAADITRLVSALPGDTVVVFRGLPFTVRAAWLFTLEPNTRVVVADVLRELNEEANPREERVFVVAEDAGGSAPGWHAAWFERAAGVEDTVASADVLAVVEVGPSRTPTIVLSRDAGSATVYSLLQRLAPGVWRARWTSPASSC